MAQEINKSSDSENMVVWWSKNWNWIFYFVWLEIKPVRLQNTVRNNNKEIIKNYCLQFKQKEIIVKCNKFDIQPRHGCHGSSPKFLINIYEWSITQTAESGVVSAYVSLVYMTSGVITVLTGLCKPLFATPRTPVLPKSMKHVEFVLILPTSMGNSAIYLSFADLRRRVSDTPFPSMTPRPTVGKMLFRQET